MTKQLRDHVRTVTVKGQVTIPVEVRRLLKVRPLDKVVFHVVGDRVELRRMPMTLGEAFGSVPPIERLKDPEEVRRLLDEERAERWLQSERRQSPDVE